MQRWELTASLQAVVRSVSVYVIDVVQLAKGKCRERCIREILRQILDTEENMGGYKRFNRERT